MNEKIKDLVDGTTGVIGEIIAEDVIPALGAAMLKGTAIEVATGAVSAISPRIGGIMIAYKQKRLERNWEQYIALIAEHQEELNQRLNKLEEKQSEKIKFIVNGFINLSAGINMQEDTTLMYYDTLSQLSMLDLRVLKLYTQQYINEDQTGDDIYTVMADYQIDMAQVSMIKEKLLRQGLLLSQNEEKMEENINNVSEFIEGLSKNKKNLKLKRINKIRRSDSYKITSYGRKFLNFFTDIAEEQTEK